MIRKIIVKEDERLFYTKFYKGVFDLNKQECLCSFSFNLIRTQTSV